MVAQMPEPQLLDSMRACRDVRLATRKPHATEYFELKACSVNVEISEDCTYRNRDRHAKIPCSS